MFSYESNRFSYMRPNTPHYVLGTDHSIMLGRHFYSTSTISDSCFAIIHRDMMEWLVTNQHHQKTSTFLRRMMSMWTKHYENAHVWGEPSHVLPKFMPINVVHTVSIATLSHIPDITTHQGLCDMMIVGNIIEFTRALKLRSELRMVDKLLEAEEKVAQWRYRNFIKWFHSRYSTFVGPSPVEARKIFQESLVQFGAALCAYKKKVGKVTDEQLSLKEFRQEVENHLASYWPDTISEFNRLLKDPPTLLCWSGSTIRIVPISDSGGTPMPTEFENVPGSRNETTKKRPGVNAPGEWISCERDYFP
jgi:hypothetical protein